MARKTIEIIIEDRGNPLRFRIREMSATKLESWLLRAILLLAGSGFEFSGNRDMANAAQFLQANGLRVLSGMDYEKAKPLLDELLGCCNRISDTGVEQVCTPDTVDGFIEDVTTLFKLRMEVIKLNLGFFVPEQEDSSGSPEKVRIGRPVKEQA